MINIVTGNMDYKPRPFSLTFRASVNSIPVIVGLIDDNIFEGNETFTLTIDYDPSSLPNNVIVTEPSEVVVVISDNNDGKCILIHAYVFSDDIVFCVIITLLLLILFM